MKIKHLRRLQFITLILILTISTLSACSTQTGQRAGQGAAVGGAVGAVGGVVSALVFGGNVGDAAARGAVWGASTGAASGAISGAIADDNQKKAQQAQKLEALRKKLGDDAYSGLEALVQCKHEVAQGYGRTATQSDNKDYALAGLWLQVIAYADSRQEEKAHALFPDLVSKDGNISSEAQAETEMRAALQKLMDIREEHNLPKNCG